jgi:hypothetical protein
MGDEIELIDSSKNPFPVYKGDIIILASDGLLTLSEREISAVLEKNARVSAEKIAQSLIVAVEAKQKQRQDNTSVQVVVIPPSFGRSLSFTTKTLLLVVAIFFLMAAVRFFYSCNTVQHKEIEPTLVPDSSAPAAPDKNDTPDESVPSKKSSESPAEPNSNSNSPSPEEVQPANANEQPPPEQKNSGGAGSNTSRDKTGEQSKGSSGIKRPCSAPKDKSVPVNEVQMAVDAAEQRQSSTQQRTSKGQGSTSTPPAESSAATPK